MRTSSSEATFLAHLTDAERKLVKDHLFARFRGTPDADLLACVEGLSAHLKQPELRSFFDMLIRGVSYAKDPGLNQLAENRLTDEFRVSLPDEHQEFVLKRLDVWMEFHRDKDRYDEADRIESLKDRLENDDIPF